MKKVKIILLFVLIVLLPGASACKKKAVEEELDIHSYDELDANELIIANDELELHFDPETTHFYVVVKDTGYIWYSNPQDVAAGAPGTNDLGSTLTLRYSTISTSATMMDNNAYSIKKGNYSYSLLGDNGIEVNYTIADLEKIYLFPRAVPESRFKQYYDKMEKSMQRQVSEYYKKYDINKVREGEDKDELLKKYPDYANEIIYELRELNNTALKLRIEDAFVAAGYTLEDYEADLARYSTTITSSKPQFNVTVQYFLEDKGLVVKVPMEKIVFKESYPLVELRVLPYFGAGGLTADGFLFIPDGSGAIINFNNGKQSQRMYKSDMYGWDYAISRDAVKDETRANMPIFGISNGSSSFICTLEEGSSYAFLEADVSGRMHDYNYACSNYYMIHNEMLDISAKSTTSVRMFQKELPSEALSQRYTFLDTSDYSSMAVAYREYLMDMYPQLKKRTEAGVPVAVELIGAVDRTRHVMGIPTRQPDELTSYKEARGIVEELLSYGMTNLSIKYNGWFNDGILHDAPNKVKLISELGSKKDFKNLVNYTSENGVNLYLEATFQFVYNNSIFDNFMRIRDGAKYVNRKIVDLMPYSPIFYGKADWLYEYNLAKPGYYLKNIDAYAEGIEKLGVKNIAFTDIGKTLSADYDDKKEVSREAVKNLQTEKLSQLYEDGYGMMLNNANMYAIPYADFIVDVNLSSKRYNLVDEEIPFMEIVLHGLVPYAGTAINLASDYERNLLKTAEYGAGLYYIFMDADNFELANSRYTKYFSSDFNNWAEDTRELYNKMQTDFGHLYNQYITEHRKLDKGVYMTAYEDGTRVIVNYNESAYSYNNKEIPAKDYIVEGGGQ
jgi:hypothetical protein